MTTTSIEQLSTIEEATVLELLKSRLEKDEIYTFAGPALIVVNPYASVDDKPLVQLAEGILSKLQSEKKNQTILLKGARGSGKTSQARRIIGVVAEKLGAEASSLTTSFEAITSVLSAIGSAKTVSANSGNRSLNETQVQLDASGAVVGLKLSSFLFDTNRVSSASHGERNFNIFYQLVSQQKYDLESADKYNFLNHGGSTTVSGVDESQLFERTSKALDTLGLSAEKDQLFSALAGIVHLGNITFTADGDASHVADKAVLARAAKYLGLAEQALEEILTTITVKVVGESVKGKANVETAQTLRDSLAQATYKKLYESVVERINSHLKLKEATVANTLSIAELPGFEVHQTNGREQLYINYINEIAQDTVHKNPAAVDTIKALTSIITTLSEQSRFPHTTVEAVHEAISNACKGNKAFVAARFSKEDFNIKHLSFELSYHTPALIGYKSINEKQKEVLQASSNALLQGAYNVELPITSLKKAATALTGTLKASAVTEVVAIRPNYSNKPREFNDDAVRDQVHSYNLVDLAKTSKK